MDEETKPNRETNKNLTGKILLIVFGLLIVGSVAVTYYRIMIKRDYIIFAEADCDPTTEKCFVYVCDSEMEECIGDPEQDTSYYKIIKKKAANIPLCDPNQEECEALVCGENEKDCEEILCEDENEDEIECNDPEQYNLDHPDTETEEETACEEGDEVCLQEENSAANEEDSGVESEEDADTESSSSSETSDAL